MFTCPHCERPINPASEVCPYCRAVLAGPRGGRRSVPRSALVAMLVGAAMVVAGVWAVVWFVLPRPSLPPETQAERQAEQALRRVAAELAAFERLEGGYPETIEQVREQVRGALEQASRQGYRIVYRPGRVEQDGNIHSFVLLARPAYYGYRKFYLDQSGVLRATREDRPAGPNDPPYF